MDDDFVYLIKNRSLESDIRTPTVQLDIFSAILQFCADILYTDGKQAILLKMRENCDFFKSIEIPLKDGEIFTCHRGVHLY